VGLACSTEIEFIREALPEARVERVAHMMAGAHVCRYEVRPRRDIQRRT
jgi:DeoR family transcriptional regulator, suf operon transcriptional repressor